MPQTRLEKMTLRQYRTLNGFPTSRTLADAAGVSYSTMARMEGGRDESEKARDQVAKALKVTREVLHTLIDMAREERRAEEARAPRAKAKKQAV